MKHWLSTSLKILLSAILIAGTAQYLMAATWQAPSGSVGGTAVVSALHTGSVSQTKSGDLEVGGLASDGRIFVSTAEVPFDLPQQILMYIGGIAQADYLCLNGDSNTCLMGNEERTVFSGRSPVNFVGFSNTNYCGPSSGNCQSTVFEPGQTSIYIPFAMTLKDLRVETAAGELGGDTGCEFSVVKNACAKSSTVSVTALACNALSGSCSNTTATVQVAAGDCISLRIKRSSESCLALTHANWSFQGEY